MGTLIEDLPKQIARLEAKHGPNDPYVKDLKEQLRASIATQGKSAQEVFRMQSVSLAPQPTASAPETEADAQAAAEARIGKAFHNNPAQMKRALEAVRSAKKS